MSILGKIIGSGAKDAVTAVGDVFDELFTSDEERAHAQAVMEKLRQQPGKLQAEINKIEASHRSMFVAGWRPFIGWVCGLALAYHYILLPLMTFGVATYGLELPVLPEFDMETLDTVLYGMLGFGAFRSFEKHQGKSK